MFNHWFVGQESCGI